jgi:hypothetical protein
VESNRHLGCGCRRGAVRLNPNKDIAHSFTTTLAPATLVEKEIAKYMFYFEAMLDEVEEICK